VLFFSPVPMARPACLIVLDRMVYVCMLLVKMFRNVKGKYYVGVNVVDMSL
jgi:hypothetical protein